MLREAAKANGSGLKKAFLGHIDNFHFYVLIHVFIFAQLSYKL
jgi:hypothetical protein